MNNDFNIIYRPVILDQVLGNSNLKLLLKSAIMKDSLRPISLFTGLPGTGKSTFAKVTALALQCPNTKNGIPCLECEICKSTISELFLQNKSCNNIHNYNMAAENRKGDAEELISMLKYRKSPKYKKNIYILEEPQNMSPEAQDTLLTTFEYLPKDTHIIFCTTDLHKMKKALISRAQPVYRVEPPNTPELVNYLANICTKNGIILDEDYSALRVLARAHSNITRDCMETLQLITQTHGMLTTETVIESLGLIPYHYLVEFYEAIDRDIVFIYKFIDTLKESGYRYSEFIKQLIIFTKDSFKVKAGVDIPYYTKSQKSQIVKLFSKYTYKDFKQIYEAVSKVNTRIIDTDDDIAEAELIALALRITEKEYIHSSIQVSQDESRKSTKKYQERKTTEIINSKKQNNKIESLSDIMDVLNVKKVKS